MQYAEGIILPRVYLPVTRLICGPVSLRPIHSRFLELMNDTKTVFALCPRYIRPEKIIQVAKVKDIISKL